VVVRLLEACDGLVVLATGRERLQVSPERIVPAISLRVSAARQPLPSWLRDPVALRGTPCETRPGSSETNACQPVR
jgi:hypothetical protein